jgi:hypothetical protein
MDFLVPLLMQGSEWLIVIALVAIPVVVIGLIVYVVVKLGLAGAGALNRVGRNSPASQGYVSSSSSPRFCGSCGTPLSPGLKFCSNCGKQL